MKLRAFFVAVVRAFCAIGLALPACDTREIVYTYIDADAGASTCTCTSRPADWDGPLWIWIGTDPVVAPPFSADPPSCPSDIVGGLSEEWHAGLNAPPACAPCTCLPSTGKCAPPSKLTASAATCPGGVGLVDFDPPPSWDGGCDNSTQVPANAAKSLTIGPLAVTEESCAVGPRVPEDVENVPPYTWNTLARVCYGKGWKPCDNPETFCIPPDQQPPGFHLCVVHDGDHDCSINPDDYWPDKYQFYRGAQDDRQCIKDCACGPPMGGMCTAKATIYQDNACGGSPVEVGVSIGSTMATCVDIVPAGQALGSKSVTHPTYVAGTCEPIPGESVGGVTPKDLVTVCCKPSHVQ